MKGKSKVHMPHRKRDTDIEEELTGYPAYPSSDDIYGRYQKEGSINPEEPTKNKFSGRTGSKNMKDFSDDLSGDDLDVPGSELDDDMEIMGEEDEENNYYSLGGDNHNDLEEDNY